MPDDKGESFEKRVAFKATDDDRRVAIGGVMVPDKVDLQGDYLEADLIEQFSDEFMAGLQGDDGESTPGVMHAVFPEDHVTLAENRILDDDTTIGGKQFPAGSWVQGWKFEDDELWGLVKDDILSGYSIGASSVEWSETMSQEDLPEDVTVADAYPEDEPVWQILDGKVGEVSSVDIPAVPDAVMVAAKAGDKSVLDAVGGKNEFVGVMEDRGHDEDSAERLWHYLQRALDETEGKSAPTPSDTLLHRLGKGVMDALTGGGSAPDATVHEGDAAQGKEAGAEASGEGETGKESRTLSGANRRRLMAAHDALETALASDVDFNSNRFSDNPFVDFDVADYDGKVGPADAGEQDEKDAPGGDTSDSDADADADTKQMSDNSMEDAPEWAKALHDDVQQNSKQIDTLTEKVGEGDSDGDGDKDAWADAPEWAKEMRDEQKELDERVEDLAGAAGKSQQLSPDDGEESSGSAKADLFGLPGGEA